VGGALGIGVDRRIEKGKGSKGNVGTVGSAVV